MNSIGLWLPESYLRREQEVRARGVVIAVTGPDIGLPPMSEEGARRLASELRIETTIPLLARVELLMGTVPHLRHAGVRTEQLRAARELLPEPYRQRAVGWLKAGRRDVVFGPEQLLLAMRLVIEHGRPGPAGQADLQRVARLLLGLTDIMVSGEEFKAASAEDVAVAMALRRLGLPRIEQPRYELARWHDLLVTRARAAADSEGAMDLDALFRARTGLAIEEYLGIAFFHAAPLLSPRSPGNLMPADSDDALAQLQDKYRDSATAAAASRLLIADVDTLRTRFGRDTARLHRSSLRPFWEHPFVRLDSGRVQAVSATLALNRGIRGVYHLLVDQAGTPRGRVGDRNVNNLTSFIGRLHEEYLTSLLRRALSTGRRGILASEADVMAATGRADKPPFDAAIIVGDTLVLIEMLTATLRLATMERCDPALYRADFDRDFKKKARQVARAVQGVGNGTWVIPGAPPPSIRRVVPVLASLHPFPLFVSMWRPFATEFAAPNFGHGAIVMPLQLVTDEDLEVLEALQATGSMEIVSALARRAANPAWVESRMTHVIQHAWGLTEPDNPGMLALYRTAAAGIRRAAVAAFDLV